MMAKRAVTSDRSGVEPGPEDGGEVSQFAASALRGATYGEVPEERQAARPRPTASAPRSAPCLPLLDCRPGTMPRTDPAEPRAPRLASLTAVDRMAASLRLASVCRNDGRLRGGASKETVGWLHRVSSARTRASWPSRVCVRDLDGDPIQPDPRVKSMRVVRSCPAGQRSMSPSNADHRARGSSRLDPSDLWMQPMTVR